MKDSQRSRQITIAFPNILVLLLAIGFSAWAHPLAQYKKTIIRRLTLVKEPVEVSFKLKGESVKLSEAIDTEEGIRTQEFEADSDWLKDLTLKLRNTSGKTITYIVVNLHFPEATRNGRTALHQILLGVDPDRRFPRAELRLLPNEEVEVPLATSYDDIRTLVKTADNRAVETVTKVWVEFHAALLDDGTLFQAGMLYRRDPNNQRRWIIIDK